MADNPTTYAMKGKLVFSRSGWLLLEVPNDIGNGAFKALSEHGIEQPISETTGRYNAHISVMRPDEIESIGGPEKIKARGQTVGFNLGPVREIANPGGWAEVSKVWVIEAKSPELMKLRRSLGLPDPKYPFHITFAIRKKNALNSKVASIIHFQEKQGSATAIRDSAIEGKGLFATRDFNDGDIIDARYMVRSTGSDGRDSWEQSNSSRFTNHSSNPNCELLRDGDTVKLVASRDVANGEELTGDYNTCGDVLGSDFDFTYHGKPYGGESSTQSRRSEMHPTSRAIVDALYANTDAEHRDDRTRSTTGIDHNTDSEVGVAGDHANDPPSASDSSREKTGSDHCEISGAARVSDGVVRRITAAAASVKHSADRYDSTTGCTSATGGSPRSNTSIDGRAAGNVPGKCELQSGPGGNVARHRETSICAILKSAVNKNRSAGEPEIDYGERLRALRIRRGECPGCGTTFKPDEPYPNVENCEVCERYGPPKLVKEGTALAVQIANARKQTVEPKSKEQAQAGNYAKGKFRMHGLPITLENPKGSTRSGTDPNGKAWTTKMTADYGYITGTEGKDGDHVDVFIGPDPHAELVYVVDQVAPDTGKFDEHKCMLGYVTEEEARAAYLSHYDKDWKGLQAITPLTMKQFRWWLDHGAQTKPMAGSQIKAAAASSFYLDAVNQTPLSINPQTGIAGNIAGHLQRIKARGDRAIQEAGSFEQLQNAMDPNRSSRQLSDYLAGRRQSLVSHPLDRLLSEVQ